VRAAAALDLAARCGVAVDTELCVVEIEHQGYMWKRGGGKKSSAYRLRWFVLTKDNVLHYYAVTDKVGIFTAHRIASCSSLREMPHFPFASLCAKSTGCKVQGIIIVVQSHMSS
jgi:hypothetical protein